MKNNTIFIVLAIVVLLVVAGGGYYAMTMKKSATPGSAVMQQESTNGNTMQPISGTVSNGTTENATTKAFTVTGSNFAFDIKEMKVKKGDTVKVTFKNSQGFHDWGVDEFNARTKQLQANGEDTVTFVADKAGSFEYYCSVGNHRQMGMVGTLTVEE